MSVEAASSRKNSQGYGKWKSRSPGECVYARVRMKIQEQTGVAGHQGSPVIGQKVPLARDDVLVRK